MMMSTVLHLLPLFIAALAALSDAKPTQQKPLVGVDTMAQRDRVPGHSNALYGPVPKENQLLDIEFLEVAPTPIDAYAP